HEAGDLGVVRTDVPAHLHTRPAGKAHVEDGHVRQDHGDTRERLLSGTRLTHHGHVVLDLQESRHTAAHDLVIVHEEDPDLFPGALAVARHRLIPIPHTRAPHTTPRGTVVRARALALDLRH